MQVSHKQLYQLMADKKIKVVIKEYKEENRTDVFLRDNNGFLNSNGEYSKEPTELTFNLSGNGKELYTRDPQETIDNINLFFSLHDMENVEDFVKALTFLGVE